MAHFALVHCPEYVWSCSEPILLSLSLGPLLKKTCGAREMTTLILVASRDVLMLSSGNFSEMSCYLCCLKVA